MWCTRCFRTKDFSSPFTPSSEEEEEVFDVSSQKRKKKKQNKQNRQSLLSVLQFLLKTKHSVLCKASRLNTKTSCYHSVFKSNLDCFHFFNQTSILGSHSALGAFLPKFCSIYNPPPFQPLTWQFKGCWEVPKPSQTPHSPRKQQCLQIGITGAHCNASTLTF